MRQSEFAQAGNKVPAPGLSGLQLRPQKGPKHHIYASDMVGKPGNEKVVAPHDHLRGYPPTFKH